MPFDHDPRIISPVQETLYVPVFRCTATMTRGVVERHQVLRPSHRITVAAVIAAERKRFVRENPCPEISSLSTPMKSCGAGYVPCCPPARSGRSAARPKTAYRVLNERRLCASGGEHRV